MIDLHTHTTASDGSYSPSNLINLALEIKLEALAITDHDCTDGIEEALAAAKNKNIKFVPGIELSAQIDNGTLHIVGLFIDHKHPSFVKKLKQVAQMRADRNPKIATRLTQLDVPVSIEEAQAVAGGKVIGRPHFAEVMMKKGFVKNTNEAFKKYLGLGGLAEIAKERLSPQEVIEIICAAGGVPILAHPDQTKRTGVEFEKFVSRLMNFGLAGIEVFCPSYTTTQRHQYSAVAKKFNLLRSGGSDFHGKSKPDIKLGRGFGSLYVPDELLSFIEKANNNNTTNCTNS